MTDCDLAARAKAGDRAAIRDILRAAASEIRRIAFTVIRARNASLSLLDDATAEGLIVAWRAIPNWNPRVSLVAFAQTAIRGAAHEVVSAEAYAVRLGEKYMPVREDNAAARAAAKAQQVPLDEPIKDGTLTLADVLPGPHVDAAAQHDAARALQCAKPQQAVILWRVACGDEYPEIAADLGCKKQNVHQQYNAALTDVRRRLKFRKAA